MTFLKSQAKDLQLEPEMLLTLELEPNIQKGIVKYKIVIDIIFAHSPLYVK